MTAAQTLQKRAARLTTRQTHRFIREEGDVERVTLEPLLELLAGRLDSSQTLNGGGAAGPKSKPPIAVDALDLLREIDDVVADTCREYGLTVRHLRPPIRDLLAAAVASGDSTPGRRHYALADRIAAAIVAGGYRLQVNPDTTVPRDVIGNLRQLVPALLADAKGDPDDELLVYWSEVLAEWTSRIEATIGDREEGTAHIPIPRKCPDCEADTVRRVEDGETFRAAALTATVHRHEVQAITCGACGRTWRRGDYLDDLLGEALPRTDALGYDLALGYAPPMFTGAAGLTAAVSA